MNNQSISNHAKYLNHILLGNVIDSWLVSMFIIFLPGKNPTIWNSFSKFISSLVYQKDLNGSEGRYTSLLRYVSLLKWPEGMQWMRFTPFEVWLMVIHVTFLALLIHPILIYVFALALRLENSTKQNPFKMLNR